MDIRNRSVMVINTTFFQQLEGAVPFDSVFNKGLKDCITANPFDFLALGRF
jgi:hypothetical protein